MANLPWNSICYLCHFISIFRRLYCAIFVHTFGPCGAEKQPQSLQRPEGSVKVRPTYRGVGVTPVASLRVGTRTERQLQQVAAAVRMRRRLHQFQDSIYSTPVSAGAIVMFWTLLHFWDHEDGGNSKCQPGLDRRRLITGWLSKKSLALLTNVKIHRWSSIIG